MNAEFCGMIGRAPSMQELFAMIRRLAPHVRTVLVTGETGTGKELVARALHRCGPRSGKRFIAINCSAVSRRCSRASCSDTPAARSPARPTTSRDYSKSRTAGRCSSTKSASCR